MKLADTQYDVFNIPIHEIWVDDDFNCRQGITRESLRELINSIDENGLSFPIGVQPIEETSYAPQGFKWKLIYGFRRLSSVKVLGWEVIPAYVHQGLTEHQASFLNLNENLARKDLNILEEAIAIDKMFPVYRTIKSIALELNQSEHWVAMRRKLLLYSEFIQKAAASGRLSESQLKVIYTSHDPDEKAAEILRAKRGEKTRVTHSRTYRKKSEVKDLTTKLLKEGFNPNLLRILSWCIGEVDEATLNQALSWLRDRKGYLK